MGSGECWINEGGGLVLWDGEISADTQEGSKKEAETLVENKVAYREGGASQRPTQSAAKSSRPSEGCIKFPTFAVQHLNPTQILKQVTPLITQRTLSRARPKTNSKAVYVLDISELLALNVFSSKEEVCVWGGWGCMFVHYLNIFEKCMKGPWNGLRHTVPTAEVCFCLLSCSPGGSVGLNFWVRTCSYQNC